AEAERYRAVKGWQRLDGRELAVLRELAAWRERTAARADIRPNFVANDVVLVTLAARPVESLDDLRHARGLSAGAVDRHGKAILAAIRAGLSAPRERWPEPPPRLRRKGPPPGLGALLRAAVQTVAAKEDIAPGISASARDIEGLAVHAGEGAAVEELAVSRGWRRALVGETLIAIARGELALRFDPARRAVVGEASVSSPASPSRCPSARRRRARAAAGRTRATRSSTSDRRRAPCAPRRPGPAPARRAPRDAGHRARRPRRGGGSRAPRDAP